MLLRWLGIRPFERRRFRLWTRATFFLGIALVVLSFILTYAFIRDVQEHAAVAPAVPVTAVLVAAHDLPARTRIADGDVKVAQIDPSFAPVGALTAPADAIGRVTALALVANEPLLPAKLIASGPQDFSVLQSGERITTTTPDLRALSIAVPDAAAVGGVLQPGDTVDILVAARIGTDPAADISSRIAFQRVLILARKDTVYTIRVDAGDAEKIAYLQASGASLQFLLRAPGDDRNPRASGADGTIVAPLIRPGAPPR